MRTKTMRNYILLLLLCVQGLYAQVEFMAVPSRTTIGINETLTVEFTMNEDGDNFGQPSFKGFRIESGPRQRIISALPGKREYSKIYTYVLQPVKRGALTIGQATIEIGGKVYKTLPLKITVTEAVQAGTAVGAPDIKIEQGLHYVAEVSNSNPYVNEPVTVVYKLYVHDDVSVKDWKELDSPGYNNFWSQNIAIPQRVIEKGRYNGEEYRVVTLRKDVLYPQKNGALPLEPLSLNTQVEVPTGRNDRFGNPTYNVINKVVSTAPKSITVKALPEAGKPAGFKGATGDFTFKVSPSKTSVASGEAFQLVVSVSGRGNLKLFDLPKPVVPAALEIYDPQHRESVNTTLSGMQGEIADAYTVIPQFKGKFTIKPLAFSFFDPKLGIYRTIRSNEVIIDVPTGPDATAGAYEESAGTKKPDVATDSQFRFIALSTDLKPMGRKDFLSSALFYLLLLLPLLLIPVIVVLRKRKISAEGDTAGNKVKETNRMAKQYLSEANNQIGNKEAFYIVLEKALHNFLKARLSIETSEMSKQNIKELLLSKNADGETVQGFLKVIDNCEFARYAPSSGAAMQQDYDTAVAVVTALEKQI